MARTPKRARRRADAGGSRKAARRRARQTAIEADAAENADSRTAFFEQAKQYTEYLGVGTDEGKFVVSTRSRGMGKHLFSKQGRPEFRVLHRAVTVVEALTGGDAITERLFLDVGANIGTSTISALVSHRFGSAVCCEPEEENYRLLRANLALNDLEHVRSLRAAVSNHVGRADLIVTGGPPGKARVALDPHEIRDKEERRAQRVAEDPTLELPEMSVIPDVELVTLDRLVDSGVIDTERVGMLWIDVEGHEGHVLKGAGTLTDRGLPIVLEFDPDVLDRRGDRDAIHEVAEQSYTHFVDLRRQDADGTGPRFGLHPVAELPGLADRFLESARFTDLLLLRLDAGQAAVGADLPELMRRRKVDADPGGPDPSAGSGEIG